MPFKIRELRIRKMVVTTFFAFVTTVFRPAGALRRRPGVSGRRYDRMYVRVLVRAGPAPESALLLDRTREAHRAEARAARRHNRRTRLAAHVAQTEPSTEGDGEPPAILNVVANHFLLGMTMMTINVRMEKNSPRIPHPNGLRPFIIAMMPQTMAAITLPMATKIPLMPRRIRPAASGSELARITECNMSGPFVTGPLGHTPTGSRKNAGT